MKFVNLNLLAITALFTGGALANYDLFYYTENFEGTGRRNSIPYGTCVTIQDGTTVDVYGIINSDPATCTAYKDKSCNEPRSGSQDFPAGKGGYGWDNFTAYFKCVRK